MKKLLLTCSMFLCIAVTFAQSGLCDTTLWNHTYANERLLIYDSCVTITATIKFLDPPLLTGDGDYHIYVLPDAPYRWMIYQRDSNFVKHCEGSLSGDTFAGWFNVEEVCKGTIEDTGPTGTVEHAACDNFNDTVYLPNTGEYVLIKGTYVYDTVHCWNEIHPVSKMVVIPAGIVQPDWNALVNGLKVFPQPANNRVQFQFNQPPHAITLVKLYDITGQLLYVYALSETNELSVDVTAWPAGNYPYTIVAKDEGRVLKSGKFSVVH